jgi:peptide deformylase
LSFAEITKDIASSFAITEPEQLMIYPIVKYGDPVLETPAAPVTEFDGKLKKLVDDMFESMYEAQGVGLAAPQIGISLHLAVIDTSFKEDPEARLVLANPQILKVEGKQSGGEGCLSIPDFREKLPRGKSVTIRAQDVDGNWYEKTGEDLLARAFQHEIDHLNGTLYIHHLSSLKRDMMRRKIKRLQRQGEW